MLTPHYRVDAHFGKIRCSPEDLGDLIEFFRKQAHLTGLFERCGLLRGEGTHEALNLCAKVRLLTVTTPFTKGHYLCSMRAVIQRVSEASVLIDDRLTGGITKGMLILLGVGDTDTHEDCDWLAKKIASLRIFQDEDDKMNLDISSVNGSFLVVSQFTLHAKIKKGTRPSFVHAAHPDQAIPLYERFIEQLKTLSGCQVQTGEFGAMMRVQLINDGPVTILIDTKDKQ